MWKDTTELLKKDFAAWGGGGPPESEYQITVYLDYAMSTNMDRQHARDILWSWMNQDDS